MIAARRTLSLAFLLVFFAFFDVSSPASFGKTVQYFAHQVSGGGATTSFTVHNPTDQAITVQLELYGADGSLISSQEVDLAAGATQTGNVPGIDDFPLVTVHHP